MGVPESCVYVAQTSMEFRIFLVGYLWGLNPHFEKKNVALFSRTGVLEHLHETSMLLDQQ